jgi:hypothetical protein
MLKFLFDSRAETRGDKETFLAGVRGICGAIVSDLGLTVPEFPTILRFHFFYSSITLNLN